MTTLALNNFTEPQRRADLPVVAPLPATTSPLAAVVDGIRNAIARFRYRRTILSLSRLPPHLLRDMGFEPEAVYEAAEGDWRWIDASGRRG
jgi:uncharacterized protein YjiS (DUF1127 family)